MKSILILGSLPKNETEASLYQNIVEIAKQFADDIKSPLDTVKFNGDENEIYERAFELVKRADLIIGEQSYPSTGQGMEIREAAILNKPLIVIAKNRSNISGLIKGCPITKEIIYYENTEDLKSKLDNSIPLVMHE